MKLTEAREFAEIHLNDLEKNECILIMKKGNNYVATEDFKFYKNKGYEVYEEFWNF